MLAGSSREILMNYNEFEKAGLESHNMEWTDEQLRRQVKVIRKVLDYLRNRGDCGILIKTLWQDVFKYEDYLEARKNIP
jgi:hypothetical protein